MRWTGWRRYFEGNTTRPEPELEAPALEGEARAALVESLRKFQLGETGEGRLAHQVRDFRGPGVDDDFRACVQLFVREEGRHARVLGRMLRAFGAPVLARHWTATGFTALRRCIGVRTKLLVALAAEVVGGTFYALVAEAIGSGLLAEALRQISQDEDAHLAFQTDFFASQLRGPVLRAVWCAGWRLCGAAAAILVLWDHRRAFAALGISRGRAWRLFRGRIEQVVRGVHAEERGSRAAAVRGRTAGSLSGGRVRVRAR